MRLELPEMMREVLRDSVPGFTPWTLEHYHEDIQRSYEQTGRNMPWAVIGDFNRDGIGDAVMDGTDGHRLLRVALLSSGDAYRFFVLDSKTSAPRPQSDNIQVLAYQAPGSVPTIDCKGNGDCMPSHFALGSDGFQVIYWEKASSLWYWNGTAFAAVATSD